MPAPNFQMTMRLGATPGKTYPLDKEETLVGRELVNDIALSDPEVSRRHARFVIRDEGVFVEDLGSTNGTFLNGIRVSGPQQLRLGDEITFGEKVVLVFETYIEEEDVSMFTPEIEKTPVPELREEEPVFEPFQEAVSPTPFEAEAQPMIQRQQVEVVSEPQEAVSERRRGMPTWMVVLLIAIVLIICLIAITMYFMPASWWCAIDIFNLLPGCPLP